MSMLAKIIDGKKIANQMNLIIANKVQQLLIQGKRPPGLAVIFLGNDPASNIYVNNKHRTCIQVGFFSKLYNLPQTTSENELLFLIDKLNYDHCIDGILIQLPLPSTINKINILESILPNKDVDGFHPYNIGRLCQRSPKLHPCTPLGIITLLKKYNIDIRGLHAVIVGASNIVGRPLSMELLMEGCTITVTHRFTKNLKNHIQQADLLIVAIGKPHFIPGNWIKAGAIVIDAGINRLSNGILVGDIDFHEASKRAMYITPVPGGVGPMTVAMLIQNTMHSYELNLKIL